MSEEKYIILTHNEIQQIFKFCATHNYENVVIFSNNCGGIGDTLHIALQDEWNDNKNCEKQNITDYESF